MIGRKMKVKRIDREIPPYISSEGMLEVIRELVVTCLEALRWEQGSVLEPAVERYLALAGVQLLEIAHLNHDNEWEIGSCILLSGIVRESTFRVVVCPVHQGIRNPLMASLYGYRRADNRVVLRVSSIKVALGEFRNIRNSEMAPVLSLKDFSSLNSRTVEG